MSAAAAYTVAGFAIAGFVLLAFKKYRFAMPCFMVAAGVGIGQLISK